MKPFVGTLLIGCCAAFLCGCESQSPVEAPTVAEAEPTPEERFERIVEAIKLWVEDDDLRTEVVRSDMSSPAGAPITAWKTTVESELIPPEEEGQPYRGLVVLQTDSSVRVLLSREDEEEENEKQRSKRNTDAEMNEEALELPAEMRGLANRPSSAQFENVQSSPIVERPDVDIQRYRFEYRDGLWELTTDIDKQAFPFNADAIEYALRKQ